MDNKRRINYWSIKGYGKLSIVSPYIFIICLMLGLSLSCLKTKAESPNKKVQLEDVFLKSETKILKIDFNQFQKKEGKINYTINLGRYGNHQLVLEEIQLLSNQFKQKIEQQSSKNEASIAQSYIGKVANQPNSKVALTVNQNFISGFISNKETNVYFEPLYHFDKHAKADEIIIYNKSEVKAKVVECGHNHEPHSLKVAQQAKHLKRSSANCSDYTVEIVLVADYDMFVKHDRSITKVRDKMLSVLAGAKTNYDDEFNDPIKFEVVDDYIATSEAEDLWTDERNALNLLDELSNTEFTNEIYDLATLWITRDLFEIRDGQIRDVDGYAFDNGLCKAGQKYNLIEDNVNSIARLQVVCAHEIGHNFGAVHDNSGTNFIMSPSSGTGGWSAASLEAINNFYPNTNCLCSTEFVDLEITNCTSLNFNNTKNISVQINNNGNVLSSFIKVGLYLSEDENITTEDSLVNMVNIDEIQPREFESALVALNFDDLDWPCGDYHYGIIADAENTIDEVNEINNVGCAGIINIEKLIIGDVNADCELIILDAYLVSQYAVGLKTGGEDCTDLQRNEICKELADMNGDGTVNILDAYQIARCAVGLDGCD